jgi:hypothetical protein
LRGLATNIICSSGDSIFVFPRKSSRLNHFFDRTTWLLLAPEARFGELAGTISGTTPLLRAQTSSRPQDVKRTRSHRLPVRDDVNGVTAGDSLSVQAEGEVARTIWIAMPINSARLTALTGVRCRRMGAIVSIDRSLS